MQSSYALNHDETGAVLKMLKTLNVVNFDESNGIALTWIEFFSLFTKSIQDIKKLLKYLEPYNYLDITRGCCKTPAQK